MIKIEKTIEKIVFLSLANIFLLKKIKKSCIFYSREKGLLIMFKKKKTKKELTTPTSEVVNLESTNDLNIKTTDDKYKTDGTIVIGAKNSDNTYSVKTTSLPEKIDIEARIKAKKEIINTKRKKAKAIDETKEARKVQSIVALIVLALFGGVYGVYYYYKNVVNNKDFSVKLVHVEYGEPASLKIADYVNVKEPDEKKYTLDLGEFVPDLIGEYTFKITHQGRTKVGKIEVSDTKAPKIETKNVVINPGDTYTPEMFLEKCIDLNSCFATFEDGSTIKTATEIGDSTEYIVIKDSFGNSETKQVTLTVRNTNIVYICSKSTPFNYNLGYKETLAYELTFDKNYNYLASKKLTTHEYIDNNNYLNYKKEHQSNAYSYDDGLSKVTYREDNKDSFDNTSTYVGITEYLKKNNYVCLIKQT